VINFIGAIVIGLVIGLIGGFMLRSKQANAIWLAPVLAVGGALIASVLALIWGDQRDYGWKEPILQVVLAGIGVAVVAYLANRRSTTSVDSTAGSA
jgi:uncharacterized membrane protein YeaQ/YmgE (transglycosylase-associated protein family)